MFSWVKRLSAATAVLSLGAVTLLCGCNNDCDNCNDCSRGGGATVRTTTYDNGNEGMEQALPTSYERDNGADLDRDRNNKEVIAPAPGFDRDMDKYQHPDENLRQNINTGAPEYGPNYAPGRIDTGRPENFPAPAPDLTAPTSRAPNATFNPPGASAPSAPVAAPSPAIDRTAPSASVQERNDNTINTNKTEPAAPTPNPDMNKTEPAAPAAPSSDLNKAEPAAPSSDLNKAEPRSDIEKAPETNINTSADMPATSNNPGAETSTTGTPRAAQSPTAGSDQSHIGIKSDNSANKGTPDVPSTSNNPGAEASPNGTPRAAQSPSSSNDGATNLNTSTPDRSMNHPVKSSSESIEYGNVSGMSGNSAPAANNDNTTKSDESSSRPSHLDSPATPGGQ